MELIVSRDVDAAPEVVWEVITDLEHAARILSGVQGLERLDDGTDFDVGTRWRETRTVFGRESTEQMEVTAITPGRSYTVVADSRKTAYTSVLLVEPAARGSTLSMSFGAAPSGPLTWFLGATLGRLFAGATRRMLEADLADLAAEAEDRHADRSGDDRT